jgi:hypothetical protein
MAHFAKVNSNNEVVDVIVCDENYINSLPLTDGRYIQTSYNTWHGKHHDPITGEEDDGIPLRKNYAGIGYTYDPLRDAFIPPKPYESWILNEATCIWDAPVEHPGDGSYSWNEEDQQWDPVENG